MEKLTIEQLAVYLPYKIQLYRNVTKQMFNISGYETFSDYTNIALTTKEGKFWSSERLESEIPSQFKLVLYPISMLTKEITHGGRTFVPIEYFEIGDGDNEAVEYDFGNIKLMKKLKFIAENNCYHDIKYLPYGVCEKLAEWHINFIGIPEELYIDKSTLK